MANETIYAGPGKFYRNSKAYFPEDINGEIKFAVDQETLPVASAMHGHLRFQQGDATGKITTKPFDHWGLLPEFFPAYAGASQGATPGALAIGTLLFGAAGSPVNGKIWCPDGRLYTSLRTGVSKPPQLHLGVGKALFDEVEITAILLANKSIGDAGSLYTITESSAADPGGAMSMTGFIRENWTLAWGTAAGFGGDAGAVVEAEEEFVVVPDIKWNFYKIGKLTRVAKLASVQYMIKGRLVGPTHTQIDAAIGINNARTLGSSFGSADATLTSSSGKVIVLKNSDPVGAGYEFGGTKLGTGEVGFVNAATLTAGAVDPLITFSA